MNTSGFTNFTRDPKYSFHEPSKNRIHFLSNQYNWEVKNSQFAAKFNFKLADNRNNRKIALTLENGNLFINMFHFSQVRS